MIQVQPHPVVSCCLVLCCLVLCCVVLRCVVLCCVVLCCVVLCCVVLCCVVLCCVVLCCVVLCCVVLCCVVLCCVVLCCVVLCCVVSCCVVLRCVTLCCAVLCCVVLCCVVLCCVVLCCLVLRCVALRCVVLCCVAFCVVVCRVVWWRGVACCTHHEGLLALPALPLCLSLSTRPDDRLSPTPLKARPRQAYSPDAQNWGHSLGSLADPLANNRAASHHSTPNAHTNHTNQTPGKRKFRTVFTGHGPSLMDSGSGLRTNASVHPSISHYITDS